MGYEISDVCFTGSRGIQILFPEMEAQLNAIDIGWPMDELVNVERLSVFLRETLKTKSGNWGGPNSAPVEKARNFYNEKIKDKPYPATEEERKEFYREFLEIGKELKEASKQEIEKDDGTFYLEWTEFTDKLQECMDKPLTFAEKLALNHALKKDEVPPLTADSVRELKDGIGKDRFGHINSTEYKELKNAFGKFDAAFAKEQDGFVVNDQKDISPEKLKNALTFGFRAEALKSQLEQGMYEVGKQKYKNTNESQSKYQKDITELLERKHPEPLSEKSQKLIDALNEIKNINTADKNLAALNAYKMGKANKHLMETIRESFADTSKMDMDAYGPKLALDSLAVLSTYTNCKVATNTLLQKVNAKIKNKDGSKLNINTATFNRNYGVKHSKELAQKMSPRPNVPANNVANPQMAAQGNQQNAERNPLRHLPS